MDISRLLSDGTYVVVKPDDFSPLLSRIGDAKIIFVGEDRHGIPEVIDVAYGLGVYLADRIGMKVFGIEGLYEWHPFMEKASRSALSANPSDDRIVSYNKIRPESERILMTGIDVEHSIGMPNLRYATVDYLFHLAHLSTSWNAAQVLLKAASALFDLKEPPETHKQLDGIWEMYKSYESTFGDEDWENIRFSFELFHESLDHLAQIGQYSSNAEIPLKVRELRGKGFRQTIEKAYLKAQKRASKLYCYVGDVHAFKAPVTKLVQERMDKWPPATWPEAMYFNRMYESTRGKVFSLLLRTLISHQHGENSYNPKGDLDDVVFERMGSANLMYVDLTKIYEEHGSDCRISMYFTDHRPVTDGVFFFREVGL
jgi:hypothetical protein